MQPQMESLPLGCMGMSMRHGMRVCTCGWLSHLNLMCVHTSVDWGMHAREKLHARVCMYTLFLTNSFNYETPRTSWLLMRVVQWSKCFVRLENALVWKLGRAWDGHYRLSQCLCLRRSMNNNQITTLPEGLFQGLTSLGQLWVCACGWLWVWMAFVQYASVCVTRWWEAWVVEVCAFLHVCACAYQTFWADMYIWVHGYVGMSSCTYWCMHGQGQRCMLCRHARVGLPT